MNRTKTGFPKEKIWLSAALSVLVFYFFNTQMHERYAHPALIFLVAYAFDRGRYELCALASVAYLLSLERVMRWLDLPNYETLIFDHRLIAVLFAGIIVCICVLLYRPERRKAF